MKTSGTLRIVSVAAAAALAVTMSACTSPAATPSAGGEADSFEALVAAAQSEGQLTLYGDGGEPTLQAWTAEFTAEYGIAVNILRLPESELFQRFSQERAAGQNLADVYSTANRVSMDTAVASEWIAEYTPENGDLFPEERRDDGFYYPVQNGYFMAVAYNPDLLSDDEIQMVLDDALGAAGDPRFEGRVALGPPQAAQHAAAFYYLQTDEQTDWSTLEAIADNGAIVQPQSIPMLQGLIAGEYAIAIAASDSLVSTQVATGAPIAFAYPVQTTGGYFNTGVVEDAPHPNAARLFMEWATTPEANTIYSDITQTIPANVDVVDQREIIDTDWYREPNLDDVWFDWIYDEDFIAASGADGDFLDRWSEIFGYSG